MCEVQERDQARSLATGTHSITEMLPTHLGVIALLVDINRVSVQHNII